MANIIIDARFYGTENTGLGRYTTNVMAYLPKYLPGHTLKVLLRRKYFDTLKLPSNCEKILCDIPHYSFAEQIKLPSLLTSLSSDLLYTFHFNTPILSNMPTVVTVHDLIKSYFTGSDTTTRTPWIYALKRAGYNIAMTKTLTKAVDVIVPTNTVKNQILAHFPMVKPEHIHPITEAPDPIFRSLKIVNCKLKIPTNYFLFVGNAYPHKNLSVLLDAMEKLKDQHLVIVAKPTSFLSKLLAKRSLTNITILSDCSDQELVSLYKNAQALVTPSLMEGYGLVGLEALMVGTPVIASNIPVYREVYGNNVTYFNPYSASDLVKVLINPQSYISNQKYTLKRTWDDVALSIAEVLNASCARLR
jgi:glycosyltransferase involved in cell wall biosynthesis